MSLSKVIAAVSLAVLLTACGPAKFDSTNQSTVKSSTAKICETLTAEQAQEYNKAILYFSFGGADGVKALFASAMLSGGKNIDQEQVMLNNLKVIEGLTGEEILKKYNDALAADKVKEEQEKAEEEAKEKVRQQEREARERDDKILDEVKKLIDAHDFDKATAKLNDLSVKEDIAEGTKFITEAKASYETKQAYFSKIEINNFKAERINTYTAKNVPAIRFDIKNVGEKTVNLIELTVYFQNKEGKTIFENKYYPVNTESYSSNVRQALKSGYVREMPRNQYYTLENTLSDWDVKNTCIEVTDLELAE